MKEAEITKPEQKVLYDNGSILRISILLIYEILYSKFPLQKALSMVLLEFGICDLDHMSQFK